MISDRFSSNQYLVVAKIRRRTSWFLCKELVNPLLCLKSADRCDEAPPLYARLLVPNQFLSSFEN